MVGWPWLLALIVGLTALQLLLYRRLREGSKQPPLAERDPDPSPGLAPGVDRADRSAGTARRCPHCGAENDPTYTYCSACVRRLQ